MATRGGRSEVQRSNGAIGAPVADYDLGTAHGKIVVDYKDNGTGKAVKDLDALKAKAGELLGKFSGLAKAWRSHSQGMVNDITKVSRAVGIFSGGIAVAAGVLGKSSNAFLAFKGANQIFSSLGLAMGSVPKGAEGFPGVVRKAIQLSAAITLFAGSTKLIQTVLKRFALLSGLGNLIGGFGSRVNNLASPLHKFAGAALSAANAVVALRIVRSIIKPVLAFGGALAAVGGAAHLVAGLATSIRDLSGAALLLPAIFGAAGLAALTFKIGISGLDEAFKNLDDPAKFSEALKNLSPAAREFAVAVREIYTKGFKELKLDVQERLFKSLGRVIQDLGGRYLPVLQDVMGRVADHLNGMAFSIGGVLSSGEGFANLSISLGLFEKILGNVGKAVPQLLRALLGITRISAQVFEPLTRGAGEAAKRFADFVNSAEGANKIKVWIESGVQALQDLWGIVKNVGSALSAMWTGLNGGEARSFLGTLNQLTAKFNEFIRSAEGQRVLKLLGDQFEKLWTNAQKLGDAFVKYVLPALEKFLPIAAEISSGVIDGLIVAMQVLGPLFSALATILGPLAPVLGEIVKWLVALAAIGIGVGVAVKMLYSTFTLLKVAVDAAKLAMGAAGFAARLLTGNLKAGELQAIKFGAAMGKKAVRGLKTFIANSKLVKGAGIALALGAVAVAMDEVNKSAADGKPLQGFEENLGDISGAAQQLASGDFGAIFADIRGELGALNNTWSQGEAPIQHWFATVKQSFMTDFVGFFQNLPAQVGGWLQGVGQSFMTNLGTPVADAARHIKDSFMTDFVGFFTGLPAQISSWGAGIATSASTMWQGFVDGARRKFDELGGEVGNLPFRIGKAIGSLIGMALQWGLQTWEGFKQGAIIKFNETVTEVASWPGRIGAAISGLAQTLWQKAVEAWQRFKDAATQKGSEAVADAQGLPARISAAVSGLIGQLGAKAQEAWNQFKARALAIMGQAVSDAQGLPGRVAAAISSLAGQLAARALAAWNSLRAQFSAGISGAVALAQSLPGRVAGAVGNLAGTLFNAGRSLIQGFVNGIRSMVGAVTSAVSGLVAGVRAYFPFSPAKKGPFAGRGYTSYSGKALVEDFAKGMLSNQNMIQSAATAAMRAANLSGSFNLNGGASAAGAVGSSVAAARTPLPQPIWAGPVRGDDGPAAPITNNYNVTLDAKSVAEMQNVTQFFESVQQKARAGKAGR